MSEPDRFDAQGDDLASSFQTVRCPDRRTLARQIATAIRREREEAAEWIRDNAHRLLSGDELAEAILKAKSPAAEVRICPRDLQEDCSAPDGEIARCTDRACPMKSPAAAPERRAGAESCRCPATWEDEDVTYRCSFTRNHPGPHNDNGVAEWVGETHHAAAHAADQWVWGTCVDCPRDPGEYHHPHPEYCQYRDRYDHKIPWKGRAPAAETGHGTLRHWNADGVLCPECFPEEPAAETGKAQGAEAYRIENLRASLAAAGKRIEELEALVGRCEEALLVPDARKERKLLADLALDRNKPRAAPPEREGK